MEKWVWREVYETDINARSNSTDLHHSFTKNPLPATSDDSSHPSPAKLITCHETECNQDCPPTTMGMKRSVSMVSTSVLRNCWERACGCATKGGLQTASRALLVLPQGSTLCAQVIQLGSATNCSTHERPFSDSVLEM